MSARHRIKPAPVMHPSGAPLVDGQPDASHVQLLEFSGTCLEGIAPDVLVRLLVGSRTKDLGAGAIIFPASDSTPHVAVMLAGTARAFLTAADGRQLTVGYARRGDLVGKHSTTVGAHAPVAHQSLTDCTLIELDMDAFATSLATEVSVSAAVNLELARRLEDVYAAVGDSAFGSVRQRVSRHLLALASREAADVTYRVAITQQQLADAVGSPREVVARVLAQWRREGLVRTTRGEIELLNVDRLIARLNAWQVVSPY